ncbi:MAG: hypothetical protein J6H21_03890 [Firmicutes bacterium]|nr:hypothetical protein [Bacillota bacterium]
MKIELLYPELGNLYGELFNIEYLRRSVPNCGIAATSLGQRPRFLDDDSIDLVYMGTMTERSQLMVVDELTPVREEIWNTIEDGQRFLITGNAMEIFGNGIVERGDMVVSEIGGEGYECLGLFDIDVERNMEVKHNSLFLGEYVLTARDTIEIVGYQSRFGQAYYGANAPEPLFRVLKGAGMENSPGAEGIHYKNFMATYVTGPLLVLNPGFMVRLCWEMGYSGVIPAFAESAMDAYRKKLYEFSREGKEFIKS